MSAEKLRPLGDGLLVRVAKAEDTSKGGIIIPENAKEKPRRGEVLAVGPGRPCEPAYGKGSPERGYALPVAVKPGEVVLFGQFAGTRVGADEDLLLLKESDLLAVVGPADGTVEPSSGAADLLESAWGVISNAGGGDWTTETAEWQKAAGAWRDRYFEWLRGQQLATAKTLPDGQVAPATSGLRAELEHLHPRA